MLRHEKDSSTASKSYSMAKNVLYIKTAGRLIDKPMVKMKLHVTETVLGEDLASLKQTKTFGFSQTVVYLYHWLPASQNKYRVQV